MALFYPVTPPTPPTNPAHVELRPCAPPKKDSTQTIIGMYPTVITFSILDIKIQLLCS